MVHALLVLAAASGLASGQGKPALHAKPQDLAWWREARFGMFVHWGPVSLMGTEIGWSRGGPRRGTGGTGEIPLDVYDNLYKRFNPTSFDADQWVAIAKAAGMKYLVFTTRHHDGFSEFDSKVSDYKITSPLSPYGKDIVKQLADACHKAGLRLGFYYSQPDWHSADYRTANHRKYVDYMHAQVRELLSNYGKVDVIWFDGLGGKAEDWDAENLFKMIRTLQPHILINNRAGLEGDFDTPEQTIGRYEQTRPWESCITICNQWAYKPNDEMKSLKQCLQTLIRCAGGDGNLLFNVGPMPTGEIEPRQVARLKEMGAWLAQNGHTIYGTRGGPFRPGEWGASTRKGKLIYLHVLDPSIARLELPPLPAKIVAVKGVNPEGGPWTQSNAGIMIPLPKRAMDSVDHLVEVTLDRDVMKLAPVGTRSGSLAFGKKARASNVFLGQREFGADKAFDDDTDTRWATDAGTHQAWIEVDLGKSQTISSVSLREEYAGRVEQFEIRVRDGGAWTTVAAATHMGHSCRLTFRAIQARQVRLVILKASEGPTISEFQVFGSRS